VLLFEDGTTKSMSDYSSLAGFTFDGVIGIYPKGTISQYMCQMSLSGGTLAQVNPPASSLLYFVTIAPDSTQTTTFGGATTFWLPVTDVIISEIVMVDTD
jgi:hypothetical protein